MNNFFKRERIQEMIKKWDIFCNIFKTYGAQSAINLILFNAKINDAHPNFLSKKH